MLLLVWLYLALAMSDIYITSKVLEVTRDLNVFTDWLDKRMAPLAAAAVSVGLPTLIIVTALAYFDAQRILCILIGMRLALLYRQLAAHRDLLWSK